MIASNNSINNNHNNNNPPSTLTAKIARLGVYTLTVITGCIVFPVALAINLLGMPILWLTKPRTTNNKENTMSNISHIVPGAYACVLTFMTCLNLFNRLS